MADTRVLTSDEAFRQELDEIERRRALRSPADIQHKADRSETLDQCSRRLRLAALCLSGGGVRSAAFCLGALQALAEKRLLREFDYLSTVSGGGFIGGWLQMLMRDGGGIDDAETKVAQLRSPPLRRLRGYTNYLTPQTGPFSADTWAAIVLYLRNLLINWAVFAPLFLLLTLVPIFYRTFIWGVSTSPRVNLVMLVVATAGLLLAVYRACNLVPSHIRAYAQARWIVWTIVVPALGWTLVVPSIVDYGLAQATLWPASVSGHLLKVWLLPGIYFVVMLVGYALAWWRQTRGRTKAISLFSLNKWPWCGASLGSALMLGLVLYLAEMALPIKHSPPPFIVDTETALTVYAPLVVAIVYLLQTALFVGLRRGDPNVSLDRYDLDREWLARVSGLILRAAVCWTAFAFCCLVLPVQIQLVRDGDWSAARIASAGSLTLAVGSLAAWLGKIAPTAQKLIEDIGGWSKVRYRAPDALAVVFAIVLLMVFGSVEQSGLGQLQTAISDTGPIWLPFVLQAALAAVLVIALVLSGRVNVNRFSMHAVYRNRLTRAFLGSARPARHPDPFTGFDPDDNPSLAELRDVQGPLPVINIALNITAGTNTAWAERKAASFTATPLVCGSAVLQRRSGKQSVEQDAKGAFVATGSFAGVETRSARRQVNKGPTLGTALTVSGAAVSPNWGYHSSRLTAFLMTLFNVRLGVWLPNPATAALADLTLAKPRNSLLALMSELIGRTTDASQAIYLSDGGHFDNLGLYEMLRRRCTTIVVIDADTDPGCAMFDLGDAIRKANIDLGVTVTMHEPMRIYARTRIESDTTLHPVGIATGTIRYHDDLTGTLLYVKPSLLPAIPAEVRAYATQNAAFPHEPITDQWFSESQFESYRGLAACQLGMLTAAMENDTLDGLLGAARSILSESPPAAAAAGRDELVR